SGRTGEDARTTRRESLFLEGRARTPGPQDARVYFLEVPLSGQLSSMSQTYYPLHPLHSLHPTPYTLFSPHVRYNLLKQL
ncbi:MAG: hypothetical protein SAK29_30145, partial [Scytonema sp. PMC 1069.18]|nr:hypothetical protein [Scytonema sp. PMC 1069.18]